MLSDYTKRELQNIKATGKVLSDMARYELELTYMKYANEKYMSFEDYIKGMQDYQ